MQDQPGSARLPFAARRVPGQRLDVAERRAAVVADEQPRGLDAGIDACRARRRRSRRSSPARRPRGRRGPGWNGSRSRRSRRNARSPGRTIRCRPRRKFVPVAASPIACWIGQCSQNGPRVVHVAAGGIALQNENALLGSDNHPQGLHGRSSILAGISSQPAPLRQELRRGITGRRGRARRATENWFALTVYCAFRWPVSPE